MTRQDSVLTAAAMPKGTRRVSRTVTQARAQEVGIIKPSILSSAQESQTRGTNSKTAKISRSAAKAPQRTKARTRTRTKRQATLSEGPIPPKVHLSKIEEQNRQREERLQQRRARRTSPHVKQHRLSQDAHTQTRLVSTRNAWAQTDPAIEKNQALVRVPLSQRALRWLEQDLGTVEERPLTINQVIDSTPS